MLSHPVNAQMPCGGEGIEWSSKKKKKKDILVEKQMKEDFQASLSEEKSGHLENNCLLGLVLQYFLIHDVKDCLMYLIKSSRTSDLCLVLRDQVTKDATGNAAANLDLTFD